MDPGSRELRHFKSSKGSEICFTSPWNDFETNLAKKNPVNLLNDDHTGS